MIKNLLLLLSFSFLLTACGLKGDSNKKLELKSPCVGAKGNPCDNRRPVNDWWLKDLPNYQA